MPLRSVRREPNVYYGHASLGVQASEALLPAGLGELVKHLQYSRGQCHAPVDRMAGTFRVRITWDIAPLPMLGAGSLRMGHGKTGEQGRTLHAAPQQLSRRTLKPGTPLTRCHQAAAVAQANSKRKRTSSQLRRIGKVGERQTHAVAAAACNALQVCL